MKTLLVILLLAVTAQAQHKSVTHSRKQAHTSRVQLWTLRLTPGQDLRAQLEQFTKEQNIQSGFIITAVGSLQKASLRLANKTEATAWEDKFEIVSLVGTLSQNGPHLHLAISDGTGKTIGGHLVSGCEIYTTAEIVIGVADGIVFTRENDAQTGYDELTFRKKLKPKLEKKK